MTKTNQILQDLADHKITKEEAKKLLTQLSEKRSGDERHIHVRVQGKHGKNYKVNVPVGLVERFMPMIDVNVQGMDLRHTVLEAICDDSFSGEVVNVETDEGDIVIVTID